MSQPPRKTLIEVALALEDLLAEAEQKPILGIICEWVKRERLIPSERADFLWLDRLVCHRRRNHPPTAPAISSPWQPGMG